MKKYAQINKGRVHGIYEYEKLPEFAPNIVMVEITGRNDIEVGMYFNGDFHVTDPSITPKQRLDKAKARRKAELVQEYINDALSPRFAAVDAAPNETAVRAIKLKG